MFFKKLSIKSDVGGIFQKSACKIAFLNVFYSKILIKYKNRTRDGQVLYESKPNKLLVKKIYFK